MRVEKQQLEDTSIWLHPLSFREAVKKLSDSPPEKKGRPAHVHVLREGSLASALR
jgi:hypothetical protein